MALQLGKKTPLAEAHEAMALLLAACPIDLFRHGESVVEYATKACDLTKESDCICLGHSARCPRRSGRTWRSHARRWKARSQYANASLCIKRKNLTV